MCVKEKERKKEQEKRKEVMCTIVCPYAEDECVCDAKVWDVSRPQRLEVCAETNLSAVIHLRRLPVQLWKDKIGRSHGIRHGDLWTQRTPLGKEMEMRKERRNEKEKRKKK